VAVYSRYTDNLHVRAALRLDENSCFCYPKEALIYSIENSLSCVGAISAALMREQAQ
jgi:hypothetical protein